MALDVAYTAELARKLEPFDLKWIEEPLMPDDYEGHAQVQTVYTLLPICHSMW
jgi:L-rhamnonate dehydratase